ncbi:MAG TPA: MFS transporter [Gaiellaceae bacterium]|jgi:MFS family permease|nr:MFS transporter [Gaiellaceae bacterium]
MASRAETRVVYAAGVAQGIALVTFPAVSTVLTDPDEYDLSKTQYGTLFLPQVVTAISAALLGSGLSGRIGTRRVFVAGLAASLVSMGLLLVSKAFTGNQSVAYGLLLLATACLGAGFGLAVPALNTFAAAFNPAARDRAILVLNALLGVGTVLAPVLVAIFVGIGAWWGLPLVSIGLLTGLLVVSLGLPLRVQTARPTPGAAPTGIPARFWVYGGFALLYGICETVNGNWSQVDMTSELGATATQASLALTAFWAMVTVGRVGFAALQRQVQPRVTYHALPFVLVGAFVLISVLPRDKPALGVLAFGLAGLGCSTLLPLTISFGQEELVAFSGAVAGGVIAFYQLGYGIAAFGIGPLVDHGVGLPAVFAAAAVVAAALGAMSFVVARRRPSPASLHPVLGGP